MTATMPMTARVKVSGSDLTPAWYRDLRSIRIERSLGVIGRATLRFSDDAYEHSGSSQFVLGKRVTISLGDEPGPRTGKSRSGQLFTGDVTGVSIEQPRHGQSDLVVIVDDPTYKLTLGTAVKTYLKMTYTDVVTKVVSAAGLSPDVQSVGSPVHDYLLRAGSAMSFINSVAERIGYVWWFDDGKFTFKPSGTSVGEVRVTLGADLTEFAVRASGLRPSAVKVSGWDSANQQTLVGDADTSASWDGTQPKILASFLKPQTALGAAPTVTPDPTPGSSAEAADAATAVFRDAFAASVVARGRCYAHADIKPGTKIYVEGAGPAVGNYLVTEVQHDYTEDGFFTRFVAGPNRPTGFVDTLARPAPDPGLHATGLVMATVTNNKDPDNLGRVKVRYNDIGDQVESTWARVVTSSGGKDRGVVFMPEVNDEVLLGFEHGDIRRPIVLGSLFSKKNALPEATKLFDTKGLVDYRRITSRKGHVIELADAQAATAQHILLHLGSGKEAHKLRLGADSATFEVPDGIPLTIKSGKAKFELSKTGDVTIEGTNITIKATGSLKLQGAQGDIKSQGPLNIQGAMLAVKASGVGSVEASGPLNLKGAMVAIN